MGEGVGEVDDEGEERKRKAKETAAASDMHVMKLRRRVDL